MKLNVMNCFNKITIPPFHNNGITTIGIIKKIYAIVEQIQKKLMCPMKLHYYTHFEIRFLTELHTGSTNLKNRTNKLNIGLENVFLLKSTSGTYLILKLSRLLEDDA